MRCVIKEIHHMDFPFHFYRHYLMSVYKLQWFKNLQINKTYRYKITCHEIYNNIFYSKTQLDKRKTAKRGGDVIMHNNMPWCRDCNLHNVDCRVTHFSRSKLWYPQSRQSVEKVLQSIAQCYQQSHVYGLRIRNTDILNSTVRASSSV